MENKEPNKDEATLLVTINDEKVSVSLKGSFDDILVSICTTIKVLATKYASYEAYQKLIEASKDDEQPLTEKDVVDYIAAKIMHEIIDEFDCLDTTVMGVVKNSNTTVEDTDIKLNFSGFDSTIDIDKEDKQ